MILALVLAIVVALVTRLGRTAVMKRRRLRPMVPALDVARALALMSIPVLATLFVLDLRSSDTGKLVSSGPAAPAASVANESAASESPTEGEQVIALANTGPDDATAAPAPAPSSACRNSTDPACGPFRWDPPPGSNAPVEIDITSSPSAPRVGDEVTVTVHVHDADALVGDVTLTFGDEDVFTIPPASVVSCDGAQAGPWSLPAPTPDDLVKTFRHTYGKAGDLTLAAYTASPDILSSTCPPNPYASEGTATGSIHVSAL